ncbi:hypothetical protein SVIOM342S_04417 [Streptomyces violaceorubidus]
MASATAGSGSVDQASSSAVPPSRSRPGWGRKYVVSPEAASAETSQVWMPGFSTTTSCPRTGRTAGSGTSSRAPRPVQLTTTGASASARSLTARSSTVPPAATSRSRSHGR